MSASPCVDCGTKTLQNRCGPCKAIYRKRPRLYFIHYSYSGALKSGNGNTTATSCGPVSIGIIRQWEQELKSSGEHNAVISNFIEIAED